MPHVHPPPESPTRPGHSTHHFGCDLEFGGCAAAWVRAYGESDLASAPQLKQTLADALGAMRLVVLDLRQLTFVDGTGLQVIIEANSRARRSGWRVLLVQGPAQVDRLLEIVGLAGRLEIIDPDTGLVPSQAAAAVDASNAA
jgi:anti-sigma B factor antagonist